MKIKITNKQKDYETLFVEALLHSYDSANENLTEEQLNENKFFDMVKWKLAKFSLRFVRDDSLNQILQAYYSDKSGNPTEKSKSVKTMSKKQKLEVLTRLADNIPEEQKRRITNSVPANALSKKIKKENIVALGTSATAGGVASAVVAKVNLSNQIGNAKSSAESKKDTTIYNLRTKQKEIVDDYRKDSSVMQSKRNEITGKINDLNNEKKELGDEIKEINSTIATKKTKTAEIERDITAKEAVIAELDKELSDLKLDLDAVDKEITDIETKYDSEKEELERLIGNKQADIDSNNEKIKANELIIKNTDVTSQEPKMKQLDTQISTNNGLITTETNKIDNYEDLIERLEILKGHVNELSQVEKDYSELLKKETA
jgi:chromosome segregation ATPase